MTNKINKLFIYFMIYSVIGWIYEVFLEVVVYKWGFTNRGVLFGPYCPVYGFGAIVFILLIYNHIKDLKSTKRVISIPIVFVLCMIIATIIELVTSYILEYTIGSWPWQTYVDYAINFQGRIALSPSIRFGIGGVIFLYLIQPLLEIFTKKLGNKKTNILSIILLIIIIIDCMYTIFIR